MENNINRTDCRVVYRWLLRVHLIEEKIKEQHDCIQYEKEKGVSPQCRIGHKNVTKLHLNPMIQRNQCSNRNFLLIDLAIREKVIPNS